MEDACECDRGRAGRVRLRNHRRGELAVCLLQIKGGAVARGQVGNCRYGAVERETHCIGRSVAGGPYDGGPPGDRSVPAIECAGLLFELHVVGRLVDDVGDLWGRYALRRAQRGEHGHSAVLIIDGAGEDISAGRLDVFSQDGVAAGGAELLNLVERNGDLSRHVTLKDDGAADPALESPGELIAVGEDDEIRRGLRGWLRSGIAACQEANGCPHKCRSAGEGLEQSHN